MANNLLVILGILAVLGQRITQDWLSTKLSGTTMKLAAGGVTIAVTFVAWYLVTYQPGLQLQAVFGYLKGLPWPAIVAIGVLAGFGSNYWHDLLEAKLPAVNNATIIGGLTGQPEAHASGVGPTGAGVSNVPSNVPPSVPRPPAPPG